MIRMRSTYPFSTSSRVRFQSPSTGRCSASPKSEYPNIIIATAAQNHMKLNRGRIMGLLFVLFAI